MSVERGTLVSFDSVNWKAVVRLDGSAPQTMVDVRVSRAIASGDMTAGRRVLVDAGDHGEPSDHVLTAIWT